jgi:hypothetical protein
MAGLRNGFLRLATIVQWLGLGAAVYTTYRVAPDDRFGWLALILAVNLGVGLLAELVARTSDEEEKASAPVPSAAVAGIFAGYLSASRAAMDAAVLAPGCPEALCRLTAFG